MQSITKTQLGMDIFYNESTIYIAPGCDRDVRRKADIASRRCWAGYMGPGLGMLARGIWAISDGGKDGDACSNK